MIEHRIIPELLATRPNVAISIHRAHDSYFSWDGDGPDPRNEGFDPYNVTVRATTIHNGRMYVGEDTLGGSYFQPDESFGEIHGYFPQMLEEALRQLDLELQVKRS